ncbi:immunity-related GTPase family, e4 isoform X1, partial [Silurus meridionalis]
LKKAAKKAQKQIDQFFNVSLHIAVTGESGTGKSSFINAIRELDNDDEGAAKTGVTETTTEPTAYEHPTMPNVTLWDLPGIGTPKFRARRYLKNMQFNRYDFFIIISSERFKENDIMLAKEIKKRKKLFYFVRSKIDNDLRAEETKTNFNKEETLSQVKRNCLENLVEVENPKVFLISSADIKAFDFEKLVETLMSDLPQHKQLALLQSVPITSVAMLKNKVRMFEKAAWAAALCSGVIAAAPVPGLSVACDASILVVFFTRCFFSLGLDNKSLSRLSKRVNKPQLESSIKSPLVVALAAKSTARLFRLKICENAQCKLHVPSPINRFIIIYRPPGPLGDFLEKIDTLLNTFPSNSTPLTVLNDFNLPCDKLQSSCLLTLLNTFSFTFNSCLPMVVSSCLEFLHHLFLSKSKKAQKQIDQFFNVSLHIAVTGESGTGKSSFINAIRELDNDDEGAAKTGVTETTTEPTAYEHPTMPNVTLWDLPGIGTPKFRARRYLKNMQFNRYDFFIIISSERFKENDIMLAKEIKKRKKLFYFVRSKIDNDLRAEETKTNFNKEETLSQVKRNCLENLVEVENPKVFLISSADIKAFDFEKLVETLMSDLPQHKQLALLQSVPITSVAMLKNKVRMFEKAAWAAALCSGVIAAAPVPGLSVACDASILVVFFTRCFFSLGLDNKSLSRLSKRVNKPQLESSIKSPLVVALAAKSTARLSVSAVAGGAVLEYLCTLVPGVGNAAAAGVSFVCTLTLLKNGLKELDNAAMMVLKE